MPWCGGSRPPGPLVARSRRAVLVGRPGCMRILRGGRRQALGERRADAAKAYLRAAGVDGEHIKTISYGKERPFCSEHNEGCWQKNRCTHFAPSPGTV